MPNTPCKQALSHPLPPFFLCPCSKLETLLKEGLRPSALYTIPVYHNPTGYTLDEDRRKKLIALAREYNFYVLADEVYELLGFEEEDGSRPSPPKPLYFYDEGEKGKVVSVGSFSKILAPALRLGYLVCPANVMKKISDSGQLDSSGGINPVISGIVHKAIDMGLQAEHLKAVQKELGERARTLAKALHEHLPKDCWFQEPAGGYFLWIRVPEGVDGESLAHHALINHKVKFLPGLRFGDSLKRYIRLSFSYYNAADLATGAQRLGEAIKTYVSNGGPVGAAATTTAQLGGR